jgi:aspartyl-tRNA(Asn)/glutamyl-tRNA(Gln) amidotransferase subunit C
MDAKELHTTAQLALLDIPDAGRVTDAFAEMLAYFETMMQVDISDLEPTTHALARENRLRADISQSEATRTDDADTLIALAPESKERFFKIPNVL